LDILNQQALDWLERTANAKVHSITRLVPHDELQIEKGYLKPFVQMTQRDNPGVPYGVRKDNTVLFCGNRYVLPIGTYNGPESSVRLKLDDETLFVMNMDGTPLDSFNLETRKGILVRNNDRKRDTSLKIIQLEEDLYSKFSDKSQATLLIASIRDRFPRYIRDQFFKILTVIRNQDQELIDETLLFCTTHSLLTASEFANVFKDLKRLRSSKNDNPLKEFKPLATITNMDDILSFKPQKSNLNDYNELLNPIQWKL
jgi:hypothetical protein